LLIEGAVTLRRVFNYLSMAIVMILILSGCQNGSQEETKQHSETKHAETKQIKLSEQDRDTLKQELLKIADEYAKINIKQYLIVILVETNKWKVMAMRLVTMVKYK